MANRAVRETEEVLARLSDQISQGAKVSTHELREALRQAASLLCSGRDIYPSIIHLLVGIPFQIFTKDSINFGISIWLGVIHEHPQSESRILVEVAEAWERTVERGKGVFDPKFESVHGICRNHGCMLTETVIRTPSLPILSCFHRTKTPWLENRSVPKTSSPLIIGCCSSSRAISTPSGLATRIFNGCFIA